MYLDFVFIEYLGVKVFAAVEIAHFDDGIGAAVFHGEGLHVDIEEALDGYDLDDIAL